MLLFSPQVLSIEGNKHQDNGVPFCRFRGTAPGQLAQCRLRSVYLAASPPGAPGVLTSLSCSP